MSNGLWLPLISPNPSSKTLSRVSHALLHCEGLLHTWLELRENLAWESQRLSVCARVLTYLIVRELTYTGLQISWQDTCAPGAKGARVAEDGFPGYIQRTFSPAFSVLLEMDFQTWGFYPNTNVSASIRVPPRIGIRKPNASWSRGEMHWFILSQKSRAWLQE